MYGDIFQRFAAARQRRKLQRISEGMPDHLLRDVGFERDEWGRIHRVPIEPRK